MYISRDLFFRSMMFVLMIGQWFLVFTEMITYITNKAHWLNMFAFNMLSYMVFTFRCVVTAIAVPQSFRRFYDVTLNLLLQVFISFKKLDLIFVFVLKINMVSHWLSVFTKLAADLTIESRGKDMLAFNVRSNIIFELWSVTTIITIAFPRPIYGSL